MAHYWHTYREHYLRITRLSLPIIVAQLGTIITGYADTMMVGHYSTEALASAAFVNNVFNFLIMLSLGFSYGITPLAGALFPGANAANAERSCALPLVPTWAMAFCYWQP